MAGKSDYLENKVLDHVLGGGDYTRPATVYIGLYTATPSDSGGGTEVAGNGYDRADVTNNATNFPASSGGAKSNGTAITFAAACGWQLGHDHPLRDLRREQRREPAVLGPGQPEQGRQRRRHRLLRHR